ncbi:hypothetical protein [Thermomonospora umbrina]|uniref:Uncharacterized protein n=1 Tax=Thermomonospora umbrina TaxID=111806 RepID=A0A3D9SUY4_9ACTN|nr:hypothetical protein [Thermomonospora umbrina]REE97853.1 hypothetical protein DFJ69_3328 [Thermomonospora umbrina]
MIDTGAKPEDVAAFTEMFRPLTEPEAAARGHALSERLDEIADVSPRDPRVTELAGDLAAFLPDEMAAVMITSLQDGGGWLDAMSDELSPAQTEVFRRMVTMLKERG